MMVREITLRVFSRMREIPSRVKEALVVGNFNRHLRKY